jgi:uncharacterized protein DUF6894
MVRHAIRGGRYDEAPAKQRAILSFGVTRLQVGRCIGFRAFGVKGEWAMTRYFFDVVGANRSEHDALGTSFSNRQEAFKWAQLLALTLAFTGGEQELVGGRLCVRDSDGCELLSVPILRRETALPFAASSRAAFRRGIESACGNKLWAALRGRLFGVKAPELPSENGEKATRI